MSRTTVTPAPARTDGRTATPTGSPGHPDLAAAVRRRGLVLAAGAATWALSMVTVGANPETTVGVTVSDLTALPFQVGVMALLGAMSLTGAVGTGRGARVAIRVERVLLSLAMLWTVVHGCFPAFRDAGWLAALDVFWPLSMLGMFLIGIKVAVSGRWRGAARAWPVVAESWAVVCIPVFATVGAPVSDWVGGAHLLVGYTVLGLLLARRTGLVLPRG
ncbi:hypothetical protein KC207_11545 [Phycicoccus sp. BSK3Z-2]|uniref:DUF998 domain-containing protein n=1 Tax=Phycicoccus avicenniae TaxID=2828860 RepID=A0A941DAN7_9MICO|nr:hypothetical protein [Phycicoccus avicenniae]MBR7743925.1 hypothetical protein [Phycicoccus avicenniae]